MPRGGVPVLFRAEDPSLAPYAEQLAAFKAEKGVGPHDTLPGGFRLRRLIASKKA